MEENRKEVHRSGRRDLAIATDPQLDPVAYALEKGRSHLAEFQQDDGTWSGQVAASNLATAKVILLHRWIDRSSDRLDRAMQALVADQQADGGYSRGAPVAGHDHASAKSDLDTTVLVHLIRRLAGEPIEAPAIQSSCIAVENLGSFEQCESLTKYWLALFGQVSWSQCPAVWPPKSGVPAWWPTSLARAATWNQQLQLPLSILWATRPRKVVGSAHAVSELFNRHTVMMPNFGSGIQAAWSSWLRPVKIVRKSAFRKADRQIADQVTARDGLGGSLDATILAAVALISRGHDRNSRAVDHCLHAIDQSWDEESNRWSESAATTVDTAFATRTLAWGQQESGKTDGVRRGVEWLLAREQLVEGSAESSAVGQGGWCREHSHPSVSVPATAAVLLTLREQFSERPPSSLVTDDSMVAMIQANSLNAAKQEIAILDRVAATSRRARHWVMAMQNHDGGWGHCTLISSSVGRMQSFAQLHRDLPATDKSTVAATGLVLQSMGAWEMGCGQAHVDRAVSFLRSKQNADGSWLAGHDACEYQATWAAVEGLRAVGIPRRDSTLARAADWLERVEQSADGWCHDPLATAWAVMCLVATGHRNAESTQRGVQYLLDSQQPNDGWSIPVSRARPDGSRINPYVTARTSVASTTYPVMALACYVRQTGGL